LNTYCRPFVIPPERLGIWCPEQAAQQLGDPYLRVLCFDPDQLQEFPLEDVAGWFKQSNERIYSAAEPAAEFEVSCALTAGIHRIQTPPEFHAVDELLMIASRPAANKDEPSAAVLVLRPKTGEVEVLEQKWFTANRCDVGYQWIARVARDPVTGRIVGDGIRLGKFELSEDGQDVARWLE